MNIYNPFSENGLSDRVDDINAQADHGDITEEQRQELLGVERNTRNWVRLKQGTLAFMLILVGSIFLAS